ncbi:MAG: phosphomethylpyrimidine synthase ThiC [Nanoarchaeota archaeon]|nr:phosphomethylpyrimidine synthase ThiC [Nanoarchaeota archaeon]MBU1005082.1 phosphomethylpyrimidine synthase ThiC [Nanoarchaeota archaeon]MBU1945367.1 phosphomethylpyrimidine synthase ThiC [Nanoarchaeota archaeon]
MTQLEKAKFNDISKEMQEVAKKENIELKQLVKKIAEGKIVIPASTLHKNLDPIGIGEGLKIKINANLGSSPNKVDINEELEKLKISIKYGADTVMDLSTGGDIDKIRKIIIENSTVPIGTVPIYQAVIEKGSIEDMTESDLIRGIKKHIEDGVDFITVHSGITQDSIKLVEKRLMGAVSRGGSFLIKWMKHNNKENPLYESFDKIIFWAKRHDVTLSLGDGLRPGCLKDATDKAQLHELKILGELQKKSFKENVQSMIEGPGHLPLDQIEYNIKLQKKMCSNAPFYVLGPLVTDIAPGYDHITSAIGGTLAAFHGANFLCYVTPSEHLGLPTIEDVKEGVIASKIAAHAADIARGLKGARDWDDKMSEARANLDWKKMIELSINPEKAKQVRERCQPDDPLVCSMCGKFCSVKINKEMREKK